MSERVAIYAGTFDPITQGHLWLLEQAALIFDKLIVAIGVNPGKHCMFSLEERLDMIAQSVNHLFNVEVTHFTNQYLIDYAKSVGAEFIIRGIRNEADYEYERGMRNINGDMNPLITTIFLMPPREISELSSSLVKGLIGPEGWENLVKTYVPVPVFEKLKAAHYAKSK